MCDNDDHGREQNPKQQIRIDGVKCMILGDTKTGKTNLFKRLLQQCLPEEYSPTVFDVVNKEVTYQGEKINLTLWDSTGSSVFDSIRPISYAHTDCFIICYAIDDRISFQNIEERWMPEIAKHGDGPNVPIILVGTKSDLIISYSPNEVSDLVTDVEIEGMAAKVKAQECFKCSPLSSSQGIFSSILDKAITLSHHKKIQEEKPPNPIWKFQSLNIIITGDSGVGKSSIVESCIKTQTRSHTHQQNGTDYLERGKYRLQEYYYDLVSDGCEYFLRIIELPFGNEYDGTLQELSEQADLIIMCYAINDPFSFQSVSLHCQNLLQKVPIASRKLPLVLIGNKSDLKEVSPTIIPTEDGEDLMAQMKLTAFIECSSETGENISTVFKSIFNTFQCDIDS